LSTVFAVSIWLAGVADCYCEARSWRDVQVLHEPATLLNAYRNGFLVYEDPLYGTTLEPTQAPTVSAMPSPAPTTSRAPSQVPSVMPSASPSASPTVPLDPYPPNDPPSNPQSWYYNYNTTKGARFGPGFPELIPSFDTSQIAMQYSSNYWSTVSLPPYPNNYWLEFTDDGWGPWKGVLENSDPLRNRCGNVGLQSPIDLVETGARCDETHEVRTRVRTVQCCAVLGVLHRAEGAREPNKCTQSTSLSHAPLAVALDITYALAPPCCCRPRLFLVLLLLLVAMIAIY
jgi:hypothetical protein